MCLQPQIPQVYIWEGEGMRPHIGFPPQGVAASPRSHLGGRPRREERGGATRVGLKAHLDLGFAPSHSPMRLGLGGGRTSPPGAGPLPHLAHAALWGRWPHLVDPLDPPGGHGTLPIAPKTFPVTKTGLSIYKSLPPDHSGTPRDVRDLIRDSEQHSVTTYIYSL